MSKKIVTGKNARKMLDEMSNVRTLTWVGVAFVIHVIVIGSTSGRYIRDRWLDPKGAEARRLADEAAAAPDGKTAEAKATPATAPATKPAVAMTEDERLLHEKKDNPEVKRITEAAKPSELPKSPSLDTLQLD